MIKLFLLVSGLSLVATYNFFRKDYVFDKDQDAFYKLHWSPNGFGYDTAFMACDDEDATLFYPKNADEWKIVNNLVAQMPIPANTTEVLVGIHEEIGYKEFITVDGQSTPSPLNDNGAINSNCVIMNLGNEKLETAPCEAEISPRLFVCKKEDTRPCPTVDIEYQYEKTTKKCYKINQRNQTWHDAHHTCFMEGGMLLVLETEMEADVIRLMLSNIQHRSEANVYSVGFRKIPIKNQFYTVKGKKIEDSYTRWMDNYIYNDYGFDIDKPLFMCGGLFKYNNDNLFTVSLGCSALHPFICEMDSKY